MRRLALFARPPVAGRVKTRLSPALPPALAREVYVGLLRDTLDAAAGSQAEQRVLFWAEPPLETAAVLVPPGFATALQLGTSPGMRLANAFDVLLETPADRAVIIAADCPALDAAGIDRAFAALEGDDLVLGPARNGGLYLIGLARGDPALFAGIAWNTAGALEQTLARARAASLRVAMLEPLDKLDTPADLVRLVAEMAMARPARPAHTAAALRAIGLLP